MRYTVICFDLDGTLVDTAGEISEAVNRTLLEFGVPRQDETLIRRFIGAGTQQTLLRTVAHWGQEEATAEHSLPIDRMLSRLAVHYGATVGLSARPYAGCLAALKSLHDAGIGLACLTNKEHRYALQVLRATGLLPMFRYVVGGDSLPWRKPQPEALEHVLHVMGGQLHHAAHVGDSRVDVETARAAGVASWAVPWGYNGGEPIVAANPDRLFDSFPALAAFVLAAHRATEGDAQISTFGPLAA